MAKSKLLKRKGSSLFRPSHSTQVRSLPKTYSVVRQEWLESERGWGQRPDGCSYHLTNGDLKKFVEVYWKSMPKEVPEEYSRPNGNPTIVNVGAEVYRQLKKSKYGIRSYR